MDSNERAKIADVIQERDFQPGEKVLTEGEAGNVFYLIISGEAFATKLIGSE
jgi:CRP-like cAMP-binding protein